MQRRVFISYSTRSDKADVAAPDVMRTRDKLIARLRDAGYIPLVDRELRSGQRWRHQIYRWIALCDAAVVLFSRSALSAPWVRKEVELLMWRYDLAEQQCPLILPFRLGDVQPNEVSEKEFSATFINQLQAPAFDDDDALANAAIASLAALPPKMPDKPLRQIEYAMATHFSRLSEADLDQELDHLSADAVAFDPDASDPLERKRTVLAAALLDSEIRTLRELLATKKARLADSTRSAIYLLDWVTSFRVDEEHGAAVFRRSRAKPREIAITSQYPGLGRHYVARGYLKPTHLNVETPVLRADEQAGDAIETVVAQIAKCIIDTLPRPLTRAQLRLYLRNSDVPRFIAFQMLADDPELRLRLQDEFETVTFLFFTRQETGQTVPLSDIEVVEVDSKKDNALNFAYNDAFEIAR